MTTVPPLDAWQPWSPPAVAARLSGVGAPWCVVGGWALDLWAGHQSRPHDDLEIAVPAARFAEVRERFPDCDLYLPVRGELQPWAGAGDPPAQTHQTWLCQSGRWRLDVMREPHTGSGRSPGDRWVCRRDPSLRLPYPRIIRQDAAGVPYLRPELVLLFKARARRPKDTADFERVTPALSAPERRWLAQLVDRVHGAGHPWVALLRGGATGSGQDRCP